MRTTPPASPRVAIRHLALLAGLAVAVSYANAAGEPSPRTLFDPADPPAALHTTDATTRAVVRPEGTLLEVRTGADHDWPGIAIPAPDGHWDLAPYARVSVRLRNPGDQPLTVSCRVDNPGANGTDHCVTGHLKLSPGESGILQVPLRRTSQSRLDGRLFGMRGYPVAPGGPRTVVASNITRILLFLNHPKTPHVFQVGLIRAEGRYTPPTAWVTDADPYFPFIDRFGQYRHKDWPGKVHSVAELRQRAAEEAAGLAARPGPADWCEFGGWKNGPRLAATGFFRTAKLDGIWWLVDPHGHLFWSHGIDCVLLHDRTMVEEREHFFEDFAGLEREFPDLFGQAYALKGHYAGRRARAFSFGRANLRRKYGPDWARMAAERAHQRLRSWGLNTIGNWSDPSVTRMRRTPYTANISSGNARRIEGSEGYWGKFPDVFDPGFARALERSMAAQRHTTVNDPWCLGWFSDNELAWGDELSLGLAALQSPPDQPAKQAFLDDLKAKYRTIEALNAAWGTAHASWESLAQSRDKPDVARARADLEAFYTRTAERYFRTVRETIRRFAPRQLYLGCRFAWVNDRAAAAAARFCDVVSYNRYQRSVADLRTVGTDKPLLIGEFHFGALDRGLFHTGLVPVANQAERAAAYDAYVRSALGNPQCVGTHWFQYQDEPTTGRTFDEENYQIGFVDIADTPYPETVAAARSLGENLYRLRQTTAR